MLMTRSEFGAESLTPSVYLVIVCCPFSTLLVKNTGIIECYCFYHSFLTAIHHNIGEIGNQGLKHSNSVP